ncbi:hypothetical protein F2P81_018014 [Scophthalmus maximus]|uniref:Sphingomyelin synthase-like domain-containing protein n=1 Tax=Scophthalmus maximus TaxID=52904 RepID=A0A6A4S8N1_SCOMX|nr:hypothetical protein F2P81_018014 [Scophthalmus maximus]
MAASELIQDSGDVRPHVEADVTTTSPPPHPPTPPRPPRVANGLPAHHASSPPPPAAGKDEQERRTLSSRFQQNQLVHSLSSRLRRQCDYVKITVPEERANRLPTEWWKTAVAFLYALFILVFTTVIITVVHERVPDKSVSPPLPDKFFDYVDRVPWAFTITEVNGLILVGLWLIQWIFLKHKAIVGRRCFFLIGTLYMYRCITMYITTLPVPGKHMVCAPKLYNDSTGKIWRILRLISGGDSPRWMWWYHGFCWLLCASGVICILIGHEHYSIDVVIGYFAQGQTPDDFLSRTWWNPIFNFLEKNVQTPVPLVFCLPVALPSSCRQRYRMVEAGRDE